MIVSLKFEVPDLAKHGLGVIQLALGGHSASFMLIQLTFRLTNSEVDGSWGNCWQLLLKSRHFPYYHKPIDQFISNVKENDNHFLFLGTDIIGKF